MKNKFLYAFTLIEVVVAIGVLSVGVLAIAMFFANSSVLSRLASNKSISTNLAQGVLDEQIATSYDELQVGQSEKIRISDDDSDNFYRFFRQVNINYLDENLNNSVNDIGLKKVEVTIYYQEGESEKNVKLVTIKSRS